MTSPHPWHRSGLIGVAVSNCVYFVGYFAFYTYVAPILIRAGAPEELVPALLLIFGATGLGGLWFAGAFVDRHPRAGLLISFAVVLIGMVGLSVGSRSLLAAVVCATLISAAQGAMPSFFQSAIMKTGAVSPDVAGATLNAAANVGIAGGALAGSLTLLHLGTGWLAPVGVVGAAAGALIVIASRRGFPAHP